MFEPMKESLLLWTRKTYSKHYFSLFNIPVFRMAMPTLNSNHETLTTQNCPYPRLSIVIGNYIVFINL